MVTGTADSTRDVTDLLAVVWPPRGLPARAETLQKALLSALDVWYWFRNVLHELDLPLGLEKLAKDPRLKGKWHRLRVSDDATCQLDLVR